MHEMQKNQKIQGWLREGIRCSFDVTRYLDECSGHLPTAPNALSHVSSCAFIVYGDCYGCAIEFVCVVCKRSTIVGGGKRLTACVSFGHDSCSRSVRTCSMKFSRDWSQLRDALRLAPGMPTVCLHLCQEPGMKFRNFLSESCSRSTSRTSSVLL